MHIYYALGAQFASWVTVTIHNQQHCCTIFLLTSTHDIVSMSLLNCIVNYTHVKSTNEESSRDVFIHWILPPKFMCWGIYKFGPIIRSYCTVLIFLYSSMCGCGQLSITLLIFLHDTFVVHTHSLPLYCHYFLIFFHTYPSPHNTPCIEHCLFIISYLYQNISYVN